MSSALNLVQAHGGELATTSLLIAEGTETQHKNVLEMIRNNRADFEEFGMVAFETRPRLEGQHGGGATDFAILNEPQATLLMTYMRNTTIVRDFKKRLVHAFYEMRNRPSELTGPELMAKALQEAASTLAAKDQKIAELEPKAGAFDAFMDADGTFSVGAVGKMLGLSQKKIFDELRNRGILISKGAMRNTPYQQYMKHFAVNPYTFTRSDGTSGTSYTPKVQPSGVEFIRKRLGRELVAVPAVSA